MSDRGAIDSVMWVKRIGKSSDYQAYETRDGAWLENPLEFIRGFYLDDWRNVKGPKVKECEIVPVKIVSYCPLRIERVEVEG